MSLNAEQLVQPACVELALLDPQIAGELRSFSPGRETVASLVSPCDPQRGRRAVDALIDAALVTVDESGNLHQTV